MQKFQRNYKVVFEIGNFGGQNGTDLIPQEIIEVAYPFTCRFTTSANLNSANCGKCQMQLLNLPEIVQKKLYKDNYNATKYMLMEFYAGYQNEMPLIFYGFVNQCYTHRDSGAVDFVTDIQADSNQLITYYGFNNVTIAKDSRFEDVLQILTKDFPWYKPRYITPKIKPLASNKTFIGQTLDLLGREYGQYDIYIDKGELNVLDKNEVVPGDILVINSKSGLLGSPKRAQQYLEFDMIFEPRLKLAQAIELQSSSIVWFNQLYKVYGIEHKGVISPVECGKVTTKVTLFLGDDPFEQVREYSQMQSNNNQVTSGQWSKPIKGGRITSQFGYRKAPKAGASTGHKGIDIGVPYNTPVYAPENGTVTGAYINGGFGRFISVNHGKDKDGNLLVSWYGHLNKWLVSPGQKVSKGQQIGLVGSTGVSTGPHLHFQVMKNGSPVNPIEYIGAWG